MDGDVIGNLGRMRPPEDGIGGSVEDVLGVGTGQVGREGDVEGMVDDGVADLGRGYRRRADAHTDAGSDLVVWMEALHRHTQVGSRGHAEGGTHPL